MSFLQRREASRKAAQRELSGEDTDVDRGTYPALFEFLTCDAWPDGSARRLGTLLVFIDDYRVKVCLSDRDQGLVMFVTCSGVHSVLHDSEKAIRDPAADWRPAKGGPSRRSGK